MRLEGAPKGVITRRDLLIAGGAAALNALLTSADIDPNIDHRIVTYIGDRPYTPFELKSPQVGLNKDGLPISITFNNGERVPVNALNALRARKRARETGEPQVAQIFKGPPTPITRDYSKFEASEAHPLEKTLPPDILSKEALRKRGVEIINTDRVTLHIRESAFAENGPLGTITEPRRKIIIALLDGPMIVNDLLDDERYDSVRRDIRDRETEIKVLRKARVKEEGDEAHRAKLHYERVLSEDYWSSPGKKGAPLKQIKESSLRAWAEAKTREVAWANYYSDSEVYFNMPRIDNTKRDLAGLYKPNKDQFLDGTTFYKASNILYVSVGNRSFNESISSVMFYPDGTCHLIHIPPSVREGGKVVPFGDSSPHISQTHPDPQSFSRNKDASPSKPDSYPYAGLTPGLTLRHEAAHDELRMTNHPDQESEYWTDEQAMQGIRDAWEKWKSSKFIDNSGYCFVFQSGGELVFT